MPVLQSAQVPAQFDRQLLLLLILLKYTHGVSGPGANIVFEPVGLYPVARHQQLAPDVLDGLPAVEFVPAVDEHNASPYIVP